MTNEVSKVYVLCLYDGVYEDFVGVYSTIESVRARIEKHGYDGYIIREVGMDSMNGPSTIIESKFGE